jgi:bZIP transcription factor
MNDTNSSILFPAATSTPCPLFYSPAKQQESSTIQIPSVTNRKAPPAAPPVLPQSLYVPPIISSALPKAPTLQQKDSTDGSGSDTTENKKSEKRPRVDKEGNELSEKKLRRLEKNRLSARECRRRKREATENIQHQINALEAENLQLRLQLQIGEEAESNLQKDQCKASQEIQSLLQSGASEADIFASLEEFKEKYADFGKSRRSSIEFHLERIEKLLMPTQTTSFVMHTIHNGDAIAAAGDPATAEAGASTTDNPSLDPKSLFHHLVQYLRVTPEQANRMKDSRKVAQEMDNCLEQALAVLAELKSRLAQTGDDLEHEFDQVRAILTPTQAAKFLVWVANNDACMHLLDELWERVYQQQSNE